MNLIHLYFLFFFSYTCFTFIFLFPFEFWNARFVFAWFFVELVVSYTPITRHAFSLFRMLVYEHSLLCISTWGIMCTVRTIELFIFRNEMTSYEVICTTNTWSRVLIQDLDSTVITENVKNYKAICLGFCIALQTLPPIIESCVFQKKDLSIKNYQ